MSDKDEEKRQDRWHQTRDAVLPECYSQLNGVNDDAERADRASVMADLVARRRARAAGGEADTTHTLCW